MRTGPSASRALGGQTRTGDNPRGERAMGRDFWRRAEGPPLVSADCCSTKGCQQARRPGEGTEVAERVTPRVSRARRCSCTGSRGGKAHSPQGFTQSSRDIAPAGGQGALDSVALFPSAEPQNRASKHQTFLAGSLCPRANSGIFIGSKITYPPNEADVPVFGINQTLSGMHRRRKQDTFGRKVDGFGRAKKLHR